MSRGSRLAAPRADLDWSGRIAREWPAVAGAQVGQRLVELGAGGVLARGGVGEDLLAPVGGQVIDLAVVVLAAGGHPGVPDLRHHAGVGSRAAVMPLTVA
jgi:hypothetical protein